MYTMPRTFPQVKRWLAPVFAFAVVLLLVFFAGVDTSAQKKKKPAATKTAQQQSAGTNANTQTAQQKPQKKNITPLRSGDTSDGSRITITSDAPLNDYSAYRSGDRYYVVIPEANAPRAQSGLRGRGFEDVQVQKRGNDAVMSFKLQPGTNARVSQRFNRLDVELTTPGGKIAAVPTATPKTGPTPATQPTPQTIARPTPQTANTGQTNIPPVIPGANNPALTQPATGANPTVVYAPTPDAAASPAVNPEASPGASPPAEQIAQVQPPVTAQPATTTSAPATSGTTLGAALRQNWLVILIAALVLLSLVMIVAARSRARSVAAATPARRTSRKEKREARKAAAKLTAADTSSEVAAPPTPIYKTATLPKARPVKAAPAITEAVAEEETIPGAAAAAPILAEETEAEVAPAVDVERVETEVGNVLAGESYDEEVIGASDAGTRGLVAAGLLAALAARNVEKRERAREVFIKHNYLDEATRTLRTADAPAERAAAARSLGYVQDKETTMHLVVALEDDAPEVRRAAVESLAELRDPAAVQPLKSLLKRERDRKVSRSLIKRAIEASAAAAVATEETATHTTAPATALETETVTLEAPAIEAEQPSASTLAEIAPAEAAADIVAAPPLVTEEADTEAEEEAARREALEEDARQQAEAERLRVEAEERQAEEERRQVEAEAARQKAEEEARERARQEEEERRQAKEAERERAEAARRQAEEEARLKAEEEARLAAAAEAEDRRRAEAEAARLRAEEEERERVAAEERRQAEEVAARLKLEQEAARKRAEEREALRLEEERRAEEERLRLEEESRQRAEAEAARIRAEEEAARLRAAAEQRQREEAEEARRLAAEAQRRAQEEELLAAQAEERRRAEEERARQLAAEEAAATLNAEAVSPIEIEATEETIETFAIETPDIVSTVDPLIERNDATVGEWVEVDISEPEIVRHAEPMTLTTAEETEAQHQPELLFAEPTVEKSKELEQSQFSIIEEPVAGPTSKEIDYAVTEKGVAEFDEFSTVPGSILKRLSSEEPEERAAAVADLARVDSDDSFRQISAAFDDPAVEVRNAAARSLFGLKTDRAETFTRALRESPPERRRKIGSALASSGLASEAISQLMGESREKTYDAFSLLFLMSKAGEVQPLMRAIEEHPNNEVRLAVVKLLALSGQQEILPAFRRLAVRGSLPTEVRSAVMEAIYQISSQSPTPA
jgi:hypothetical protein